MLMNRRIVALLFLLLLFPGLVAAQAMPVPVPAPPSISAPSYILLDAGSGHVLVDGSSDEQREPASLVKVMAKRAVAACG